MTTVGERFWSKAQEAGDCWVWTRAVNSKGYGLYAIDGILHLAHRVAYEVMVAEIPPGLVIDHLCSVKRCVKPSHLEPVTTRENNVRAYRRGFYVSTPEYQAIHLEEFTRQQEATFAGLRATRAVVDEFFDLPKRRNRVA